MHIREAGLDDLEVIADLRLRFLADHRGVAPSSFSEAFRAATLDFLRRHAVNKTGRSWLASDAGVDVGLITLLVLDLAPRPEDGSNLEGYIINMYVEPTHRRRGTASDLLGACRSAASDIGLRRLLLHATDDGRQLYASVGFTTNPDWMELRL